jgi:integrase
MALTDTFVRQTKWSGDPIGDKHFDGGGMFLHVTAAGKYWRMAYRFASKQKTLSMGVYPAVGLQQARKLRADARALLAEGIDPNAAKRAARAGLVAAGANTVEAVGRAWLALHKDSWSESHYIRERRNLEKDLFPYLGRRPIADVEPPELLAVIRKVEERGALSVSHRVLTTAHGVWAHAVAEGKTKRDVSLDIRRALKPHHKGNYPAIVDPAKLAELLRTTDGHKGGPVVRTALYIVPMLFQRPGNLRRMRWADLDLDAALWTCPSEDMKGTKAQKRNGPPHLIPLPTQAVAALRELQPLTGGREYVFPGFRDPTKPMSEAAVNAALHATGYKGVHCWHGYRATGRTLVREQFRYPKDVIECQLAHKGEVSHGGAYDRAKYLEERAEMLQRWADYLDKLRQGADVIALPRRSA